MWKANELGVDGCHDCGNSHVLLKTSRSTFFGHPPSPGPIMYYRRCDACSAKALATATRCPRCEQAFELNDTHGKRHRLVPCRSCHVVQPSTLATCRWCGTPARAKRVLSWRAAATASATIAMAVTVIAAHGKFTSIAASAYAGLSSKAEPGSELHVVQASVPAPASQSAKLPDGATGVSAPSNSASVTPTDNSAREVAPAAALRSLQVVPGTADSSSTSRDAQLAKPIEWERATATTWVNVRADRNRDANVVAVLNPDDVVQLGVRADGWRRVQVGSAVGWVDPRHFDIANR